MSVTLRKRVKSGLDFVQNELEIHCTEDGEKINMNIEVRNNILDFFLKCLGKTSVQISNTLSKV